MFRLLRPWTGILIAFAIVGVCAGAYWACSQIERKRVHETYQRAGQIIQALGQYRSVQGHYPRLLVDLCPQYIERIPEPTSGNRKWIYYASDDGLYFSLGFKGGETYPSRFYDSKSKEWWVDTK
jgi:hypothetical protein